MKSKFILLCICYLFNTQIAQSFPIITDINPAIKELMEQVSITRLEADIRYLQNFGPRPYLTKNPNYPNNIEIKKWLIEQYENNENLEIYLHHFLTNPQTDTTFDKTMNVVAIQKGNEFPDEYIIVCSHFDSHINSFGAGDNGTGVSAVLEIARILSQINFKRSIIYLNSNAEETTSDAFPRLINDINYSYMGS
jgi:hypothetical protein